MNICSVVVTFNRKELLLECINALLNQTYDVKNIIIIDNNSTDGTENYLNKNGILDNQKINYVKLNKNIGGAGGFNEGIKKSLETTCEWVWIMDDDTIPELNALEELLIARNKISEKTSFLCSKVIGMNNEEMNIPNISKNIGENGYSSWMKYLNNSIVEVQSATFVSVLINMDAVRDVGLPWKEFFIWGDDIEYTLRLSNYYGPGFVVGKSIVIHKRYNARNITIIDEDNLNRINFYKYKYRNDILISSSYGGIKSNIITLLLIFKDIKNILISKSKLKYKKISIILKSSFNGFFNIKLRKKYKERIKKII